LLSACASEADFSPVFDEELLLELPAEDAAPDFDDAVFDSDDETSLFSFDVAPEATEPEAPAEYIWDEDDWDFAEEANEETIRTEIPSPVATPEPTPITESVTQDYIEPGSAPMPIITPDDERGRRLTYDVRLELQSTNFTDGTNLLAITVAEMGGFVLNSSMQGSDIRSPERERVANYDFRLPTENLPEFLVVVRANFNVINLNQTSEDITVDYERETWEFEDLTELEEVLEGILEDNELNAAERRDIEAYLAGVRADIRTVEQRRSAMDYDILYSFITIRLEEVIPPEPEVEEEEEETVETTFGDRFGDAAASSFGAFVGFGQGLLIVIVTILPTLIILGAIAFAIIFSVRKYKKWRVANPKSENRSAPPNPHANYQNNNNMHWNYNDPNNPNNAYNNQNAPTAAPQTNVTENPHDK